MSSHVHSPAGGQGMNTGIQDAYNLGWKLEAVLRGADNALLDTYDEERRPVARAVLEDSTKKMGGVLGTATERGALSRTLSAISDDLTTGLLVSYRSSSLTRPTLRTILARTMPGDRAPNAESLQGTGFAGNLFDLFRGPHWTLLAFVDDTNQLNLKNFAYDELHVHCIVPPHAQETAGIIDAKRECLSNLRCSKRRTCIDSSRRLHRTAHFHCRLFINSAVLEFDIITQAHLNSDNDLNSS